MKTYIMAGAALAALCASSASICSVAAEGAEGAAGGGGPDPAAAQAPEKPAAEKPVAEKAAEKPAAEKPVADAPAPPQGMAKMRHGSDEEASCTHGGHVYEADKKGFITVPLGAVEELTSHGFVLVRG